MLVCDPWDMHIYNTMYDATDYERLAEEKERLADLMDYEGIPAMKEVRRDVPEMVSYRFSLIMVPGRINSISYIFSVPDT